MGRGLVKGNVHYLQDAPLRMTWGREFVTPNMILDFASAPGVSISDLKREIGYN
jgi:hypothetical protein